ncbi:hypothetical protein [Clostridium sp. BJN0013]|uniref:hypothetical protein n=1 Tax=Clostridium sp. BJN0013 TaxID=3236840 RepID=UPI0034C677B5
MSNTFIKKRISDFCPKYNTKISISVKYQDISDEPTAHYQKIGYRCDKNACGGCNAKPCPVYENCSEII